MKRRALLIGNSKGLGGVKLDIQNYRKFLKSNFGGQWFDSEITVKMNPTKSDILKTIQFLTDESPDFVFVAYSGHGAYKKTTILEINEDGELISENDLIGISKRQISIFDCCRECVRSELIERKKSGGILTFSNSKSNIRVIYENRIMQASEQQVRLYACSIGETSLDTTEEGGLYTKNLISSAKLRNSEQFYLLNDTHVKATFKTKMEAFIKYKHTQSPSAMLPCSDIMRQLILSINPNYNVI